VVGWCDERGVEQMQRLCIGQRREGESERARVRESERERKSEEDENEEEFALLHERTISAQ